MSSPNIEISGSKPPIASNRSARTSVHAPGTAKTSRLVVLRLVELEALDAPHRGRETVDAETELQNPVGLVVVDELRRDDAGVRAEGLLDRTAQRIGLDHHVVVTEQEVRRSVDDLGNRVCARAEASVGGEAMQVDLRGHRGHAAAKGSSLAASTTRTDKFP